MNYLLNLGISLKINLPLAKILFISQFKMLLMLLLTSEVILSAFLGNTSFLFFILFIALFTDFLSFFQERNTGRVVEKLQSMLYLKAPVLRDNKPIEIISKKIVAGDIIVLNARDMLPADYIISCLWEVTNIVMGNAKALIIQIGDKTIFGNISKSAASTIETTFEKGIKDFGYSLMKITLVLVIVMLVINLLNDKATSVCMLHYKMQSISNS